MIGAGALFSIALTFGWLSLFAVGGAAAAIPEIHRIAVDLNHWMTDTQFADAYAISQLSPGPNVLIVSLMGYQVAGIAGALVATVAMCGPTAAMAYTVSRLLHRAGSSPWPALIQKALVPVSIGLMAASGLVVAVAADGSVAAALLTLAAAVIAAVTRVNPVWLLLAGGLLGLTGLL
jgi:chromate transporter